VKPPKDKQRVGEFDLAYRERGILTSLHLSRRRNEATKCANSSGLAASAGKKSHNSLGPSRLRVISWDGKIQGEEEG